MTNWVDHLQIMIDLQNACQNGMVLRAGLLLVSLRPIGLFLWFNLSGLLNNTIANRGEKFVQACGYEDLNQGWGQKFYWDTTGLTSYDLIMTSSRHGNRASKCNLRHARRLGNFPLKLFYDHIALSNSYFRNNWTSTVQFHYRQTIWLIYSTI